MTTRHHFLSIVTISFNQAPYLQRCIESIASQKSDDIQYIVVDPGSTDGSREILARYRDAIDHIILDPDNGPADGLNKGFSQACGEVGYYLNSDDLLLPGAIKRLRLLWSESPQSDIILASAWMIDDAGNPIRELRATEVSLRSLFFAGARFVQQGFSFRRALFGETTYFNINNRTCWDFEFLCELLRRGATIRVVRDRLGAFRLHGDSLSGGVRGESHKREYLADLGRIAVEMGFGRGAVGSPSEHIRRVLRRVGNGLDRERDRLIPQIAQRRWLQDHTRFLAEHE